MTDKERGFSPSVTVGDALLLLCALWGLTACFLSLYSGPGLWGVRISALNRCIGSYGGLLQLWAALSALVGLGVWSLPRFRGAAAGTVCALWMGAAALNWRQAVRGACITVRDISVLFAGRVSWGWELAYDPGLTVREEGDCVRLFLLLAIPGLALALGWAVVRARRWWLVAALTLPTLLPGLLADFYPDWPAFLVLAGCWCVMLLTSLCKWAAPTARGRLTLMVFPCVGLVLLLITAIFPMEGYTRPSWALRAQEGLMDLSSRITGFFSRWDGPFHGTVTYVGSAEEADLAHAGPLDYFGRTVLRVTSDYEGRLYLRGSSLAVYEDGVWKALPEGTYEEYCPAGDHAPVPLYFPAMGGQDGPAYAITVDNVGAVGTCVYAPYFPVPQVQEDTGALPVEDAYFARRQGQWVHTLSFVERTAPHYTMLDSGSYVSFDGPGDGQAAANRYAEYAYDHYLDVPEELREELESIVRMAWSVGVLGDSYMSAPVFQGDPVRYAQRLAEFLDTLCEYDPETPAPPAGADPVRYFLNESRRGYCMHYASAAALLLRAMGIPARYVSGFTAVSVPGRQVDVPDRAAHAWVEVWVDGFGWYPVEVTPAAAFDYGQAVGPDGQPTIPPAETETPGPTPAPSQDPDNPSAPPSAGLPGGDGDGPGGDGDGLPLPAWLVWGLAGLAGIAALLWLVQLALKGLRKKRMAGPDPNRAALACYGCLCRMERLGGRMDPRAVELAEKARFSQHTLTGEELGLLRRLADRERTRLCVASSLPKRLLFRYLWGMPSPPLPLGEDGE